MDCVGGRHANYVSGDVVNWQLWLCTTVSKGCVPLRIAGDCGHGLGLEIQIVGKHHVQCWISTAVLVDRLFAVTARTERLEARLLERMTAVRNPFDAIVPILVA